MRGVVLGSGGEWGSECVSQGVIEGVSQSKQASEPGDECVIHGLN